MIIKSSAPGKIILFGEHASSRGKPSIVLAVNSRLTTTLTENTKNSEILLSSESYKFHEEIYPTSKLNLVSKTIDVFFEKTGCQKKPLSLSIVSDILAGFGSSAAVIVSVLGALDNYYGTNLTELEILTYGLEANYAIKGYGSGLDIAAATYGGLIFYQKGSEPRRLPYEKLSFVIGNTKIKVPSGPIVKAVKKLEQKEPTKIAGIFDQIEKLTLRAEQAILTADSAVLGELMNENHSLLKELKVSSHILEELVIAAREAGAFGAKLSGAGMGDNMIALVTNETKQAVIKALNETNGEAFESIAVDPQGLVVQRS